jgi:hypothetical protein
MFLGLVLSDENIESEEARMKREEKVMKRKIASQKGQELESKWKAMVCAGQTFELGHPAAIINRSPRPGVSQPGPPTSIKLTRS